MPAHALAEREGDWIHTGGKGLYDKKELLVRFVDYDYVAMLFRIL